MICKLDPTFDPTVDPMEDPTFDPIVDTGVDPIGVDPIVGSKVGSNDG